MSTLHTHFLWTPIISQKMLYTTQPNKSCAFQAYMVYNAIKKYIVGYTAANQL